MKDFSALGTVTSVKVLEPPPGHTNKAALIRYATPQEAQYVKQSLNGVQPEGFTEPLMVKLTNSPGQNFTNSPGQNYAGDGGFGGGCVSNSGGGCFDGCGGGKGGKGGGFDADGLLQLAYGSGIVPGGVNYSNPEASIYIAGMPAGITNER